MAQLSMHIHDHRLWSLLVQCDCSNVYLHIIWLLSINSITISCNIGIVPPLIYNAYLNQPEMGVFICIVRNSVSARWIVDGYQADSVRILSRGIVVTYNTSMIADHIDSKIFIPATVANSHGVIAKCRGYFSGTTFIESNQTAIFNVQGDSVICAFCVINFSVLSLCNYVLSLCSRNCPDAQYNGKNDTFYKLL